MSRKIVYGTGSSPWWSLAWSVLIIAACLVTGGCDPQRPAPPDPCPTGCTVPAADPQYLRRCSDLDAYADAGTPGDGPCVDQVGDSGLWVVTPAGARWPDGLAVLACPTEDGGPVPCAWVPAVMGNGAPADAGVYLWGVSA